MLVVRLPVRGLADLAAVERRTAHAAFLQCCLLEAALPARRLLLDADSGGGVVLDHQGRRTGGARVEERTNLGFDSDRPAVSNVGAGRVHERHDMDDHPRPTQRKPGVLNVVHIQRVSRRGVRLLPVHHHAKREK